MKTLTTSMLAFFLAAAVLAQTNAPSAAEWQSIMLGTDLKVECSIKKNSQQDYRDIDRPLEISIALNNRTSLTNLYSAEVFFLVKGKDGVKSKDHPVSELKINSVSSSNIVFRASNHHEDVKIKLITNWVGYIVRLSAYDKPLKLIASSPALERLAKDPDRMSALESGKTVPLK